MMDSNEKVVLHAEEMWRALSRIAHEILERNPRPPGTSGEDPLPALVGIHRRGAFLAQRLHTILEQLLGAGVPLGDLDIGFYRDDVSSRPDAPILHASHIDFDVNGRTIVIVDDVLFTGRTVRAAIEALFDYGRPDRVQLAVLVDRGHRELPIRPDYVGKNLPSSRAEHVSVRLRELDGVDEVAITTSSPLAAST
ncbi:MAG: bifunctional pyr operon transcriptional regulator/uracil phosphoribosyltransferase PyrR [Solirubrobacteraceae bacterium]|jgi:pyrimidine operon attenuation protein/uracil phosphoribosyltransferase